MMNKIKKKKMASRLFVENYFFKFKFSVFYIEYNK